VLHHAGRLHEHHAPAPVAVAGRRRTVALAVLCLCAFTTAIDITITNVALPFIGTELDASTSELQWVIDAYGIVLAGLLVLGGGLADRYGRRRVFLIGYAVFGLACLLAAFSSSVETLVVARVVMGVGAAGVIAPALAIVAAMYPPDQRGGAIGAWAVFGAAGLAAGPVIGGLLLDRFWWGSVFLVNVPVVAVGVVLGVRTIPESRAPTTGRQLDLVGALLSVLGLGSLLFGIIEGPGRGWTSPGVVAALAGGIVLTVLFVTRELRTRAPLFDVRILTSSVVAAGAVTLFASYFIFNGMLFLLPQYLQDVQGEAIATVGFLLVPFAAVFGVLSTRAARILGRIGPRLTVSLGLAGCAVGSALLAIGVDHGTAFSVVASAVVGAGLSLLIAPASTVVMNALPETKAGDGSSLNMVSRFVGGAVGVAAVGSVLASVYASHVADALAGASLSAADADKASSSLQGGLEVAQGIAAPQSVSVADAARDAFDRGAVAGYLMIAALAALAALWAWLALRRSAPAQAAPAESRPSTV
jgi:EmrB/QacA subfamily drug resistance transporter